MQERAEQLKSSLDRTQADLEVAQAQRQAYHEEDQQRLADFDRWKAELEQVYMKQRQEEQATWEARAIQLRDELGRERTKVGEEHARWRQALAEQQRGERERLRTEDEQRREEYARQVYMLDQRHQELTREREKFVREREEFARDRTEVHANARNAPTASSSSSSLLPHSAPTSLSSLAPGSVGISCQGAVASAHTGPTGISPLQLSSQGRPSSPSSFVQSRTSSATNKSSSRIIDVSNALRSKTWHSDWVAGTASRKLRGRKALPQGA